MKYPPKPVIIERYADNGEFTHYELVNQEGDTLWSEDPEHKVNQSISDAEIEKVAIKYGESVHWGIPSADFRKGAEWARKNSVASPSPWIDVTVRQPEEFQEVGFIVKSSDPIYDGHKMGGKYQGLKGIGEHTYHEFSTPGVGWSGTHWMPLPDLIDKTGD